MALPPVGAWFASIARPALRLMRFPLVFTAIADVWAGVFWGLQSVRQPWTDLLPHSPLDSNLPWILAVTMVASGSLYAMGMVLNDIADRDRDKRIHPHRPIPVGTVRVGWAIGHACVLGFLGIGILLLPGGDPGRPLWIAACLVGAILLYDFGLKRFRISGSLAMGACRTLNVMLGMSAVVAAAGWTRDAPLPSLAPAILLGGYVAAITWISTWEEKDPRWMEVIRWGLLGIIPLDAAFALWAGFPLGALLILSLLIPRLVLARWIPVN